MAEGAPGAVALDRWALGERAGDQPDPQPQGTRGAARGGRHSIPLTASEKKIPMQLASLSSVPMCLDKFEHIENILCHGMEWILNAPIGSLCNILNTC